jgi:hypothetical protein
MVKSLFLADSKSGQAAKVDEFAYILLAGVILIAIVMFASTTTVKENPLIVLPTDVFIQVQRGTYAEFNFTLEGNASMVTMEVTGDGKDWINFNKNNFNVAKQTAVKVKVVVPSSVVSGLYYSTIVVSSPGGNKTLEVRISVTDEPIDIVRSIDLGDFSVSYTVGTDVLASKKDVETYNGIFSGTEDVNLVHESMSDEKYEIIKSGFVSLLIEDAKGAGDLIVEFNGKEIFKGGQSIGELVIPLNKTQIQRANSVKIKSGGSGWMFWTTTSYKIKSAKLVVNYQSAPSVEKQFNLESKEVDRFRFGKISFMVDSYTKSNDITIKINDRNIFRGVPYGVVEVVFDNVPLVAGWNVIKFSLDKEAQYDLSNVILTIVYAQ